MESPKVTGIRTTGLGESASHFSQGENHRWSIRFRLHADDAGTTDVVANNVANINTTGFKADRSLFEEYQLRAR